MDRNCSVVYDYLQQNAAVRSPSELIRKFRNLLQNGRNEDAKVSQAFEKIVFVNRGFDLFLSHCFYLIVTVWLNNPGSSAYISQLLDTLNSVAMGRSYDRRRKQLIELIKSYQQSQSYQQLKFVISIIEPDKAIADTWNGSFITNGSENDSRVFKTPLINSCLIRYPYLYQNLLPQEAAIPLLVEKITELQNSRQQEFEINLSKHIIYRFRLKQLAKMKMMAKGAGKMITKADNPSLLSERAFRVALQQYVGKIDGGQTLLERSQLFVAENKYRQTYGVFKQDFYHFLVKGIKPRNSTYQFESTFEQKLDSIFPQASEKALNPTQILQTSRQLFSFLILDSTTANDPERFAELVANLGTAQVAMILVKIVLICPESKVDLSKKIYAIADRYQGQTVKEHPWLLKMLEHLLIAFSIYFGSIDVSLAKSAVSKS